jgi:hypothetical protein
MRSFVNTFPLALVLARPTRGPVSWADAFKEETRDEHGTTERRRDGTDSQSRA